MTIWLDFWLNGWQPLRASADSVSVSDRATVGGTPRSTSDSLAVSDQADHGPVSTSADWVAVSDQATRSQISTSRVASDNFTISDAVRREVGRQLYAYTYRDVIQPAYAWAVPSTYATATDTRAVFISGTDRINVYSISGDKLNVYVQAKDQSKVVTTAGTGL